MITCTPYATVARKHLLDVVKALRDAQNDEHFVEDFTMQRFMNPCGTPACALGHYAFRQDLQSEFRLGRPEQDITSSGISYVEGYGNAYKRQAADQSIDLCHDRVLRHFGLTYSEVIELFDADGCHRAALPGEAADYIETFVARKWPQWSTEQ